MENLNLLYTGKTKDVFALENGNYCSSLRTIAPARTAFLTPVKILLV